MSLIYVKLLLFFSLMFISSSVYAGYTLPKISSESQKCIECHKKESPSIYEQWGSSKHFRANIGCYECHKAEQGDADALVHEGATIAVIVSPRDCNRCHEKETDEFAASHHSKGGRILGSLDNTLAEVIEGNRGFKTPAFPNGISSAAVNGCWQCHGVEVKILKNGMPDPATWPNTGIGRINPDGSEGACTACHSRHSFSAAQARYPDTCGKCHLGPDHPQLEIYNESKHGIAFRAQSNKMNLENPKWVVGEDYAVAPSCSTCHMSATPKQSATHDVGMRISWNNRPEISIRPEVSDAKMGLPGAAVDWKTRRSNMKDVCLSCHSDDYITSFYKQYDSLIDLYHEKFARPGLELVGLAKPLLKPAKFSNRLDFFWYELWHHEGRRARHGVAMMGPDYTHWHGTYEIARNFYSELLPELEGLVATGKQSGDAAKQQAAFKLQQKIDEVLNSDNHKWYLNKLDSEEVAARQQRLKEFQSRYH